MSLFVPLLILHCCPRPRLCFPACLPVGLEGLAGHTTVRIKSTLAGTLKGRSRTTTSDISFSAFYPPASLSVWRHDIILKQQPRPLDNDKSKQPYSMEHTYTHPANKERTGGGQKKPTRCFFPDFFRFSRILNFRAEMRCRHATSARTLGICLYIPQLSGCGAFLYKDKGLAGISIKRHRTTVQRRRRGGGRNSQLKVGG